MTFIKQCLYLAFSLLIALVTISPLLSQYLSNKTSTFVDLTWHCPDPSQINNLSAVLNSTGVWNFIFNSSSTPQSQYGEYNWCNMPHVRRREYVVTPPGFTLRYVEVIQRHHKRTPYMANLVPGEAEEEGLWECGDVDMFHYARTAGKEDDAGGIRTFWWVYEDASNPFQKKHGREGARFAGGCHFPQLTREGLEDARQHGRDLYEVYHDLLHLLPSSYTASKTVFRVTNNPITAQVARMVLMGMFDGTSPDAIPLLVQPPSSDSLEPSYPCPAAQRLYTSYGVGSSAPNWTKHLDAAAPLLAALDSITGINPAAKDWHNSVDHYFDNLSARLCHAKPLPCSGPGAPCITQAQADAVFRLGQYEYSFIHRDASQSLSASAAGFGVWVAELSAHLKAFAAGDAQVVYRHNVAHDGSIARLLSILQVKDMVWPGMGAEVVFELYERHEMWYVRLLWGGRVFRGSNPIFEVSEAGGLVKLARLTAYLDGLVGVGAPLVPGMCYVP